MALRIFLSVCVKNNCPYIYHFFYTYVSCPAELLNLLKKQCGKPLANGIIIRITKKVQIYARKPNLVFRIYAHYNESLKWILKGIGINAFFPLEIKAAASLPIAIKSVEMVVIPLRIMRFIGVSL